MSIKARVKRLERSKGASCPACPSLAIVYIDDWYETSDTQEQPAPCLRRGRAANVIEIVYDRDFYRNAHLFEWT
jgi:hypothetical protein